MVKKDKSKKACEKLHFLARYKERTGVELSSKGFKVIRDGMRSRKRIFLQSRIKSVYEYLFNGMAFYIAFDTMRNQPVTICYLTQEFLDESGLILFDGNYLERIEQDREIDIYSLYLSAGVCFFYDRCFSKQCKDDCLIFKSMCFYQNINK